MKQETTFKRGLKRIEQADAKHNKAMETRKKLFNTWINAQSDKKQDRLGKKLKRLTNKSENAFHAYIVAMRKL
jgi:hypothetical protein